MHKSESYLLYESTTRRLGAERESVLRNLATQMTSHDSPDTSPVDPKGGRPKSESDTEDSLTGPTEGTTNGQPPPPVGDPPIKPN
jgi:hypothetical protein